MLLEEARKALGNTALNMTDDEVMSLSQKVELIVSGTIDLYERTIFKGRTVNELCSDITPNLTKEDKTRIKYAKSIIKKLNKKV